MTDEGWLPRALNGGWTYRDRIEARSGGMAVSAFYAGRYRHSGPHEWQRRLAAGEIERNGRPLPADEPLVAGDRLAWHRPPWWEEAVPARWAVVHDDGDLLVLDKPSGLPVLPAGGWLEHTVLRLLERRHQGDPAGLPRPVHRLGRFTSGLLVCARRPATRAWLSRQLRESTGDGAATVVAPGFMAAAAKVADSEAQDSDAVESDVQDPAAGVAGAGSAAAPGCRKLYRALLVPGALALAVGEALVITTSIGRRDHPQLGQIWCAADGCRAGDLAARSTLTLLERHAGADLVQVAIASGRPHQIRIHCAAIGAPLLGDPLYRPGGLAAADARPGEGGYRLQAWRLELVRPDRERLELEAPEALGVS